MKSHSLQFKSRASMALDNEVLQENLRRFGTTGRAPGAPHGNASGQQRRLRIQCSIEFGLRTFLAQRPQIQIDRGRGFIEGGAYHRMRGGQRRQHADGLRALTGKKHNEIGARHRSSAAYRRNSAEPQVKPPPKASSSSI